MSNPRKVDIATDADWSFMANAAVAKCASHAAHFIARKYPDVVEEDDLYQDALLYLAVSPQMIETNLSDPLKGVNYIDWRLRSYLEGIAGPEASRSNRTVSRDALEVDSESL